MRQPWRGPGGEGPSRACRTCRYWQVGLFVTLAVLLATWLAGWLFG